MTTLNDSIALTLTLGSPVAAGPLMLIPLFSTAPSASAYICGPEAEALDLLHVTELDGDVSVAELMLTSGASVPLLVLEGETLIGAKQNRTLNVSVLCRPQEPTVLPVSCVEAGRWGASKPMHRSPRHAPSGLRAAKTRSVVESVRTRSERRSDQRLVWDTIDDYAHHFAFSSPTAAFEDVASDAAADVAAVISGLAPSDGQRGVVVGTGNGTICLDLFDKPSTLAAYWDGLLAGYALDALGSESPSFDQADAEAFVARILAAVVTETPAVGLGTELHLGDDDLTGGALTWEGAVVHLAAFGSYAG